MVIRQNGPQLQNISSELQSIAREMWTKIEDMFADCDRNMGDATATSKNWYGPRAAGCLKMINGNRPTYKDMYDALIQLSDKVNSDALSWGTQQTKKY